MSSYTAGALGQGSSAGQCGTRARHGANLPVVAAPGVAALISLVLRMERLRLREVKWALLEVAELQVEGVWTQVSDSRAHGLVLHHPPGAC